MVLRIAIAVLGFVLGILTVIRFRKYLKQNTWSKLKAEQERTLIIQVYFKDRNLDLGIDLDLDIDLYLGLLLYLYLN